MALTLSAEDALERVLGALTEEDFASVRISHSVPGAKSPHVVALDIIKVVTKMEAHRESLVRRAQPLALPRAPAARGGVRRVLQMLQAAAA